MTVYLLVALYAKHYELESSKNFKAFLLTYNIGVPLTAVMMIVRGVPQVLGSEMTKAFNGAVSGMAGIGHILTGAGIILLLLSFIMFAKKEEQK